MRLLPDFGERPDYDGKAMENHSTGRNNRVTGKTRLTGECINTPGLIQTARRGQR